VIEGGFVPYETALRLQRDLASAKKQGRTADDYLLLLEHDPVLTLGRGADPANLTVSQERLRELGISCVEIERGGDITYHGPGQLIGYPILDLSHYRRDLHWYLRQLEAALIASLARLGVATVVSVDGARPAVLLGPAARAFSPQPDRNERAPV